MAIQVTDNKIKGVIKQIIGPVIDIEFEDGRMPNIFDDYMFKVSI